MNKINESIEVKTVRIFLIRFDTSWQSNKMIDKNKHELEHIVTAKKKKKKGFFPLVNRSIEHNVRMMEITNMCMI